MRDAGFLRARNFWRLFALQPLSKPAMPNFLRLGTLFVAGLTTSHVARADAISERATDREQFIAVTRIVQLPAEEQGKAVPQLYELLGEIPRDRPKIAVSVFYTSLPWRAPDHEKLTPEAQADLVKKEGNEQYLSDESGQLACKTLQKYPAQTTTLLQADLRSDDPAHQSRGLSNLAALKSNFGLFYDDGLPQKQDAPILYASFYPEIARIFQSAPPAEAPNEFGISQIYLDPRIKPALKTQAESALMKLGNARAIALLINDDAAQPLLHYQAISALARRAPSDEALQTLVPFLNSGDAESRYRALYALPVSLESVRAALPTLIDDSDAKVRARAVSMAFALPGVEFEALEMRLKSKLADAVADVRFMAAAGFANRKNPIAAPVLLALLRDESPIVNRWWAGETLSKLTDLNRNYGWPLAREQSPADAPRNEEAIARIEAWIATHPAN